MRLLIKSSTTISLVLHMLSWQRYEQHYGIASTDIVCKVSFCLSRGPLFKNKKMCLEMVKNRPKSAKCALSMVLLRVAMATFVG